MHVEKFHKNVAGVMLDHIGRSDSKRNCKRSNENIDPERTHLDCCFTVPTDMCHILIPVIKDGEFKIDTF